MAAIRLPKIANILCILREKTKQRLKIGFVNTDAMEVGIEQVIAKDPKAIFTSRLRHGLPKASEGGVSWDVCPP